MDKIVNVGLEDHIYIGPVLDTGLPAELSAMTTHLGCINPDSFVTEKADDDIINIKCQESQDIFVSLTGEIGEKTINFDILNFKEEVILLALGGEFTTNGTYKSPITAYQGVNRNLAYKTRAKNGMHLVYKFPEVLIKGKEEGIQQEGDVNKLMFSGVVKKPTDTSGNKLNDKWVERVPEAPTNGVVDDTANTFAWTYTEGFDAATDYEVSEDTGGTWADCTVNPQTGFTAAIAVGALLVRVKEVTGATADARHTSGDSLANTEEFTV